MGKSNGSIFLVRKAGDKMNDNIYHKYHHYYCLKLLQYETEKKPNKMYCFTGSSRGFSYPYKIELRREIISQSEYKELWGGIRVIFNLNPVISSYG